MLLFVTKFYLRRPLLWLNVCVTPWTSVLINTHNTHSGRRSLEVGLSQAKSLYQELSSQLTQKMVLFKPRLVCFFQQSSFFLTVPAGFRVGMADVMLDELDNLIVRTLEASLSKHID